MNRNNIIFTTLNALVVLTMLIHIGYEHFRPHLNVPPEAALYLAFLYMPPLVLINGIWLLIRMVRGEALNGVSDGAAASDRRRLLLARMNAVFVLLNTLLAAVVTLHGIVYTLRMGGSVVLDFLGVMFYYGVPLVLIDDAWFVIRMNLKKTN